MRSLAYGILGTLLTLLLWDAACAFDSSVRWSDMKAAEQRLQYRQEQSLPCTKAGGIPIFSGWDGRLIDCKRIK